MGGLEAWKLSFLSYTVVAMAWHISKHRKQSFCYCSSRWKTKQQ